MTHEVYYNDNEPFIGKWLAQLVAAGELPEGVIEDGSIKDIDPRDLEAYAECHFFAGIGGWPLALRMAGWPAERRVWTGSCPCQPFSVAGSRGGESDPRHLWPAFRDLIAIGRPPTIFGEQVASKDGREWLARVRADLEALGYAVGAADLCAASVGAPHIRQRLYWVANANGGLAGDGYLQPSGEHGQQPQDDGFSERLAEPESEQPHRSRAARNWWGKFTNGCSDGKARRVEPSIFPLASGIPNRVGTLRGAGNAIVPQVAATFISAFLEAENESS